MHVSLWTEQGSHDVRMPGAGRHCSDLPSSTTRRARLCPGPLAGHPGSAAELCPGCPSPPEGNCPASSLLPSTLHSGSTCTRGFTLQPKNTSLAEKKLLRSVPSKNECPEMNFSPSFQNIQNITVTKSTYPPFFLIHDNRHVFHDLRVHLKYFIII